jgi:hypothetical protein
MRFQTRYDRWLVVVIVLTIVLTCGILPALRIFAPGSNPPPLWVALLPVAIWLVVIPCTLPQYYEVREDGLFLRQGWRKRLIPYGSLVEVQEMSDTRSAGVFSWDRILVVTREGKRFLIAVEEEERFMTEVAKRCPQLERKPFGLSVPLYPQTTV